MSFDFAQDRHSSVGVLVSGGLDSAVLLVDLAQQYRKVYPLYVRQGLAWESVELYWLKRFLGQVRGPGLQPLRILELPMDDVYGAHWSTGKGKVPGARSNDREVFLPGRNLVLVLKAAIFSSQQRVSALALGSLGHNPFPDATPGFFRRWASVLCQGLGRPIRILAPYRRLSKVQVIRRVESLPFELTFSCIAPRGKKHCGCCNKCAERKKAFRLAHVEDPTAYAAARKN